MVRKHLILTVTVTLTVYLNDNVFRPFINGHGTATVKVTGNTFKKKMHFWYATVNAKFGY